MVELCPLPEEFEAILGSRLDSACQIAVPPVQTPDLHLIQYQMARMFHLSPQLSLQYIFGNEIAISSLTKAVASTNDKEIRCPWMLASSIYAQFLLVSLSGNYDSKLLHILDQVEDGLNPFPLILAETITGLDNFASTRQFSGTPMLLEVSSSLFSLVLDYLCHFLIVHF